MNKIMTKQEYMAMSLPYDLEVVNEKGVEKTYAALHYSYEFEPEFEKFTPIVRPLSDLAKEIEHKGETFIPIVELAKLLYKRISIANSFKLIKDRVYFESISDNQFWYSKEMKCFCSMFENAGIPVHNQLQLFQQLIKWHFDIADLISKGEAVDVNTLNINPYA